MSRVILWFWYLVLIWLASFCAFNRLVLAAETQNQDSERSLNARIADFFLGSNNDQGRIPSVDTVTVIASRLPSFSIPFADVTANVTYIPANVTSRDKNQIYATQPRDFQESIHDVEGAIFLMK